MAAPMGRLRLFLGDVGSRWRKGGPKAVAGLVRAKLFERTEALLYELRPDPDGPDLPEGWTVRTVATEAEPGLDWLRRAGCLDFRPHFNRGGIAYVVCRGAEAVGYGWTFRHSRLARRLGSGAVYFGSGFVRPEWRGRGVNSYRHAFMMRQLPPGARAVCEVALENLASQRSLAKSGALLLGRLTTLVVCARLIRVRIEPWPPPGTGPGDRLTSGAKVE